MRQGEAFGFSPEDVEWLATEPVVHVRRQVRIVAGRLVFAPPKGGKERDVPLPESVKLRLAAHAAAFPAVAVTLPWKAPGGREETVRLMFTSREHAALNRNYVNTYLWKPALGKLAPRRRGRTGSTRCATTSPASCCMTEWTSALSPNTSATPTRGSRCGCTRT